MKRNPTLMLFGLLIIALFALMQLLFIVREGDVAVVTQLGRPVRALTEAGLYRRWPWPIQRVHRFDHRLQSLEGPLEQAQTRDGESS